MSRSPERPIRGPLNPDPLDFIERAVVDSIILPPSRSSPGTRFLTTCISAPWGSSAQLVQPINVAFHTDLSSVPLVPEPASAGSNGNGRGLGDLACFGGIVQLAFGEQQTPDTPQIVQRSTALVHLRGQLRQFV